MALESPALCDALLALASSHISLVDQSYSVVALEAQSNAIKNLTTSIKSPSAQITWHETNAATCLTFATSLISTSDSLGWHSHLQGAKHFITSAAANSRPGGALKGVDAFKVTPEGRWVLRNFAYHDIIGSISTGRQPLLAPSYLHDISEVIDSYLGVATGLLIHIGEISSLESEPSLLEYSLVSEIDRSVSFREKCLRLENELESWRCPIETQGSLASMAFAYRSAALILLYRLVRRDLPGAIENLEEKISSQVTEALRHISDVPLGDSPEAALLFPLFIAGGEAREDSQIDLIRTRLREKANKRNFQNISRALKVLESLWNRRRILGIEADWAQILNASGEELVLT